MKLVDRNHLDIVFFDWTMWNLYSKKNGQLGEMKRLLKYINFPGKIMCKFLIVAP